MKTIKQINLSLFIKPTHVCKCDECNEKVNTSFGDPREKVFRFDSKDRTIPSSVRMLCPSCIDDLFGNHEPASIFE